MIDLTNQISGLNLSMYCIDIYRDGYDHYYAIEVPISRKMVGCFQRLKVAYQKKSAPKRGSW